MTPETFPYATRWEPNDIEETKLRETELRAKPLPRKLGESKRTVKRRDMRGIVSRLDTRGLLKTVDDIAAAHHVTREELLEGRKPHRVEARVDVWEWLHSLGWSANSIGELFDYDHTTVISALRARAKKSKKRDK